MSGVLIYVFSGTDNTMMAAEMISEDIRQVGTQATVRRVERPFVYDLYPDEFDFVGFGYPVHAYNAPKLFLEFIRGLPEVKRAKAFIFKTSGEPLVFNDASSYKLYRLLKQKGFDVLFERHFLMPYNIMFRYEDGLVKQMYRYTRAMSTQTAELLLSGGREEPGFKVWHKALAFIMRIEWLGAILNGRFYSVDTKKCVHCMRCVRECPGKNITCEEGRFRFGWDCTMCMRCAMFCPKDAIHIGMLSLWKVNGAYPFKKILEDPAVPEDFINEETKGYYRVFHRFFKKADRMLARMDGQALRRSGPCVEKDEFEIEEPGLLEEDEMELDEPVKQDLLI